MKNRLKKTYVAGLIKNLSMNMCKIAARMPKIVYVAAIPRTKTRLIIKPFLREETEVAPTILKVIGTSGRIHGEKLIRTPARKLARRPNNGEAAKLLSRL
jgi:hypothetical protein